MHKYHSSCPLKEVREHHFSLRGRESVKRREKKTGDRPWRSCTKENKQLQYVYSGVPEGRRGPDCTVPSIISEK